MKKKFKELKNVVISDRRKDSGGEKTALLQTNDAFFENKNQKLIEISLGMMKLRIKMIIPPGFELSRIFRGRG